MWYLYWLHLPTHSDINTEGYVGVSKRPKQRLYEHKHARKNPHLQNAFQKYGDTIIQTILLEGTEDYCFSIEALYRPRKYIGWNISVGGIQPPGNKGNIHSIETKLMMSKNNRSRRGVSAETRHRMSVALTGRKYDSSADWIVRRSKTWSFLRPDGEIDNFLNLRKYCRDHNLHQAAMYRVAKGENSHHKGYRLPICPSENGSGKLVVKS